MIVLSLETSRIKIERGYAGEGCWQAYRGEGRPLWADVVKAEVGFTEATGRNLEKCVTAEEFGEVERAVYEAINARTDHALEGWEKLGFVAPQLRFTPDAQSPWMSREQIAKLPAKAQDALMSLAATPGHVRTYKLSPAEVAAQCAGELTKLPDHAIPLLIPMQWARPVTVKEDRTIAIKDQLLGAEAFQYVARFADRNGATVLQPGMKLLAYLNPYAPERLVVCQEDGSFLGTLLLMTRAGSMDQAAILEQLKQRSALKADLDTGIKPHLAGQMKDRAAIKRHNERLKNGQPVLPEEIDDARSEAGRKGQRTAAANRLQEHGEARDWDAVEMPAADEWQDPFACLPEDNHFPDSI